MKTIVRASLFALLSSFGGIAAAQTPPAQPAQGPVHPAPAPAPAPPPAPAPVAAPVPAPAPPPPGAVPPGGAPPPGQPAPLAPSPMYEPPPPPPPIQYGAPPPPPPQRPQGSASRVGNAMVGFAWDFGIPIGSLHTFTSKVSGVGFDISFDYWLHPQITIGGDVAWQTYTDQRDRTTYPISNGALTATAYNSLQQAMLRATAHYYFLDSGMVLPFVGVNAGYGWGTFQTAAADIVIYDNQDSFVFGADLGALFAFTERSPLVSLTARYSDAPAFEFLNSVTNAQSLVFQLGIMLY